MKIREAYNLWAEQYDTNLNKTRDLEAHALKEILSEITFDNCLEIGCGTGKNTEWLTTKAKRITAVDFSEDMLNKANAKIQSDKVEFVQADINKDWRFQMRQPFDLAVFSLVLEHIEKLDHIFEQLYPYIKDHGYVYIGELHPYKQYNGVMAKFETEEGLTEVTCYVHHISDFTHSGKKYGFEILQFNEFFDDHDKTNPPRILTLLLRKLESNYIG